MIKVGWGQITINANTTWNNSNLPPTAIGNDYRIGITINPGYTLTIDNLTNPMLMNANAVIKIKYSGHLIINGTTITSSNANFDVLWEGITLEGNFTISNPRVFVNQFSTMPSYVLNDANAWEGVLNSNNSTCIINNSNLSFAKTAVYSKWGGTVRARNSNFINNQIGAKIYDYENPSNREVNSCYFMDCTFEWTRNVSTISNSAKYGLYLQEVKGINVGGCTFINSDQSKYCSNSRGIGIYNVKASCAVSTSGNTLCEDNDDIDGCVTNCYNGSKGGGCSFSNLSIGIQHNSFSFEEWYPNKIVKYTYNLGVKFSQFNNNIYGINVYENNIGLQPGQFQIMAGTCQIQNNNFSSSRSTLNDFFDVNINSSCYSTSTTIFGVRIQRTPHDVYKNTFTFDGNNVEHVVIEKNSGKGRIVNNTFNGINPMTIATDNHFGVRFINNNPQEKIFCNNFNNMGTDIKINPGATVYSPIDGKTSSSNANNLFSGFLTGRYRVDNSGNPNVLYTYSNLPTFAPFNPLIVPSASINVLRDPNSSGENSDCELTCSELTLKNKRIEFNPKNISVYPVPSNNFINIESKETGISKILVYNSFGQLINSFENINQNSFKLNLNDMLTGIYYLAITTQDEQLIHKNILVTK